MEFKNLDKVFWPEGLTKLHLIKYYADISPTIMPYLADRPLVMKRYPDGIEGDFFYQKECPEYAPDWVATLSIDHQDSAKTVNYIVCQNAETITWLANQGCIEMHAWLSRGDSLEKPDLAVLDLDPDEGASFTDVLEIAFLVKKALEEFNLLGFPKTSGASGLHVFLPLYPRWTFREVTAAMGRLAGFIARAYPQKATTEHVIKKRRGRVYLDYLQNSRGRTMAFPYSLRPLPGAPVSAPLTWDEVERKGITPLDFNMQSIFKRLDLYGDLYSRLWERPNTLEPLLKLVDSKTRPGMPKMTGTKTFSKIKQ